MTLLFQEIGMDKLSRGEPLLSAVRAATVETGIFRRQSTSTSKHKSLEASEIEAMAGDRISLAIFSQVFQYQERNLNLQFGRHEED